MGPLFVLVSPCFRENVVVTCKIGSFLCSLNNLLQKNVIGLFFLKIKFQNGAHMKKGLFLTFFSYFLVTRESCKKKKKKKKTVQHISHSHTFLYFAHYIDFFCVTNFEEKKMQIYQVLFLFGVILGVDSYSHHFGAINKYKMMSKT